jgi:hypothetical protein
MKKYKPSVRWVAPLLVCGVFLEGSLIYAIVKYPGQNSSAGDITLDSLLFVFMGFLFLSLAFGTFFILKSGKLCRVAYFFWRSYVSIADIIEIKYEPTFFIGKKHRTLFIFAMERGRSVEFTLSFPIFAEETIAHLAMDLAAANPSIKFDEDSKALISSIR